MGPPTHILAEDSVLGLPIEGEAGRGVAEPPSQLAPPKGVEGGNLLLPALNSQDGVIREESVSSGVNAERATTPSLNYRASMTKRSAGMWINWIAIILVSIIEVISADLHYKVICADQLYSLARQFRHPLTRTSVCIGSIKNARECWRDTRQPGRDTLARISVRAYLVDVLLFTRQPQPRARARFYEWTVGRAKPRAGYAYAAFSQCIRDTAFARGSAIPAR